MKTVLFVDDQKEIIDLLKVKLKNKKYKTLFALSGDEALEIIKEETVHVVVTDLLMPGKNGITLLLQLKEQYPEIVRIVLSGLSQVSSILSAINKGDIFRYITKPWKIDEQAESIINSALEYSDFLQSEVKGIDNFSMADIKKILGATTFRGSLIDREGNVLFEVEPLETDEDITLSNSCVLRKSP